MSFSLPKMAVLQMNGQSAIDFGQRLFSRDLSKIKVHEGVLSAFLSAEGRVSEIFWVIRLSEGIKLLTEWGRQDSLAGLVEKYHFAEPFRLTLEGTAACTGTPSDQNSGHGVLSGDEFRANWRGTDFVFKLNESSEPADLGPWHLHRTRSLIPSPDVDYDASTLVFDLGFEELCDPAKGCYIGQEVVERVRTRGGSAARKLSLFEWNGKPPTDRAVLNVKKEVVGSTASCVANDGTYYSLGFVKRNTVVSGEFLSVEGTSLIGKLLKIYKD